MCSRDRGKPICALTLKQATQSIGNNATFRVLTCLGIAIKMVRLTMTPAIVAAIENAQHHHLTPTSTSDAFEHSLTNPAIGNPILHGQIIALSKLLKHIHNKVNNNGPDSLQFVSSYHLDDLLRGTRIYIEPPKPKAEPVSLRGIPDTHQC